MVILKFNGFFEEEEVEEFFILPDIDSFIFDLFFTVKKLF